MSRFVDSLPTPANPTPIKRIVVSAPRSGTQGLYFALKLLGYKPYHMTEIVGLGANHVRMMVEGFDGEWGEGKKYTRADYDKWLQDYDIFMELPFMMLESTVHAYPDAEYLFVERKADNWVKSVEDSIFHAFGELNKFPANIGKNFVPTLKWMDRFATVYRNRITGGHYGDEGRRNMKVTYEHYVAEVKRLVPAKQLHHIHLEDNYGWEPICKWLDVPVPDKPWPTKNTSSDFKKNAGGMSKFAGMVGLAATSAVVVPVIAVAAAFYMGKIEIPFTISWK